MKEKKQTPKKKLSVVEDLRENLALYDWLLDEFASENEQLMKTIQSKDRAYSNVVKENNKLKETLETEYAINRVRFDQILDFQEKLTHAKSDRRFYATTSIIFTIATIILIILK